MRLRFRRRILAGVDIVQPDIVKTGGFTGLGDMAALARAYGVDLVPHQTQPSIGHTAKFKTPVRPAHGKFSLSDAPGLGLEVDESELRKRMVPWTSSAAST